MSGNCYSTGINITWHGAMTRYEIEDSHPLVYYDKVKRMWCWIEEDESGDESEDNLDDID